MPVEVFILLGLGFMLLFAMAVRIFVDSGESRDEILKLRKHLDLLSTPSSHKESPPVEKIILFGDTFGEVANKIRGKISPEFKVIQGITLQTKTKKYTAIMERVLRWDNEEERFT